MLITVPLLVKDPEVAQYKGVAAVRPIQIDAGDIVLDGPVTRRIAVVDFDPATGRPTPGAPFVPFADAKPGKPAGEFRSDFDAEAPGARPSASALRVLAFAGVAQTVKMFEEPDALGRSVRWAFDSPQILVVPRAGRMANAYYERASRSIQLFSFPSRTGAEVHTALSQDILSHETTHAILDGIAPDLYDAAHPESLALHESVSDIAAFLVGCRNRDLAEAVLQATNGQLHAWNVLTGVAEQFGSAFRDDGRPLRDLRNGRSMSDKGPASGEPHAMSEVLSGAMFHVFLGIYDELRAQPGWNNVKALVVASDQLKRIVTRGIDYLPPGESTFVDFARALLAADEASHVDSAAGRERLRTEFVARGIAANRAELDVSPCDPALARGIDLAELVESDWVAYRWVESRRKALGIPPKTPFEVLPRLDVTKRYFHRGGEAFLRECIVKVRWSETEPAESVGGMPPLRRVDRGAVVSIAWPSEAGAKPAARFVLRSAPRAEDGTRRDALVRQLLELDALSLGDASRPGGTASAYVTGGAVRLRGSGTMLHMTGGRVHA